MYIASASTVVKFHEFPSYELIHTYQPSSRILGSCRSLSWSKWGKDGTWLAVVPHSGFAEIVTLQNKCSLSHTVQDISEPSCASFQNLTRKNLAVGTKHGQVLLYDIKARSVKARYPRTSSAITHVGFTAKDTHCYAGCANGEVLLFNSVAKNLSCTLKVPKSNSITDVKAHLHKRNLLIGGSNEGVIVVWDTNVNKIRFSNEAHKAPVTATIFSPINASLIVSAGLDRQVCVFDIEKGERITNIPVENNILSLDFLDDSKHIVMGSQNGKIHIYDSRNLSQPVYSFEAHQSAVRHVTYQGPLDDDVFLDNSGSSFGSIVSTENVRPSKSNEEVPSRRKRTSDIFGMIVQAPSCGSDSFDDKHQDVAAIESGDSFIQALGLDKNNTADSMKGEEQQHLDTSGKMLFETKLSNFDEYNPNLSRIITERFGLCDSKNVKQSTSTPKLATQNFLPAVSPIVSGMVNQSRSVPIVPGLSVIEIQNVTKEIVHDEVNKALENLESKVSYQFSHIGHQMRRMVLDLHMAILKEFIKVENYCNTIRDEINTEPATTRENHLLEENMNLKKKIQELESEISSLRIPTESEDNGNE